MIEWQLERLPLSSLTDWYKNPRQLTREQYDHLRQSLDKFGLIDKPIVNADGARTVIGGHQRLRVLRDSGVTEADCWVPLRELSEREVEELNIRLNKNTGEFDFDILANEFEVEDLLEWGFSEIELQIGGFADEDEDDESDGDGEGDSSGTDRQLGPYLLGPNTQEENGIYVGDMYELTRAIPDASVDLVFTDPPYDEASVPLYGQLAQVAARVLRPGGICAAYVGKLYLDHIMSLMLGHLPYWWMCALYQPGGGRYIYPRQLAEAWRPILALRKPADDGDHKLPRWARDAYQGRGREKDVHAWQQEILPAVKYISAWTNEGNVVLDPFCGGGTFPAAAKALNRYFLSFEIDEDAAMAARRRIRQIAYDDIADMTLDAITPSSTDADDFVFDVPGLQL